MVDAALARNQGATMTRRATLSAMPATPSGKAGRFVLGAVFVASAAALGFTLGRSHPREAPPSAAKELLANTATILVAVRGLARLETIAYHMERIIDLKDRREQLFGLLHADDSILLVAAGDVIAGVDLARMSDGDVTVIVEPNARRVQLRLPAAEVLVARLDNGRTYVYSRKTDLLAQRGDQLESRARQLAETSIRDAALEAGILDRARRSAEQTLTTLLRPLGFEHIDFVWGDARR
jgi:hypothetical protein